MLKRIAIVLFTLIIVGTLSWVALDPSQSKSIAQARPVQRCPYVPAVPAQPDLADPYYPFGGACYDAYLHTLADNEWATIFWLDIHCSPIELNGKKWYSCECMAAQITTRNMNNTNAYNTYLNCITQP